MQLATGIPTTELPARREKLREHLKSEKLRGYVLFDQHYIQYFTGFGFPATERSVALVGNVSGDLAIFVPEFEVERVRAETAFARVESYPEYPGLAHPIHILAKLIADMGISDDLGADGDGYPGILGYRGPSLWAVTACRVTPLAPFIEGMMARKSAAEIALIRESAKWCNLAHRLLRRYTRPGATETEVSLQVGREATLAMLDTLGPIHGGQHGSADGASAGYRGQIGLGSSSAVSRPWRSHSYRAGHGVHH